LSRSFSPREPAMLTAFQDLTPRLANELTMPDKILPLTRAQIGPVQPA
jgi:hypothetical protein